MEPTTEIDVEKLNRLCAEMRFRVAAIHRMFPGARVRTHMSGPLWDPSQPPYTLVIIPLPEPQPPGFRNDECHNVYVDDELSKIQRAISKLLMPSTKEALKKQPIDASSTPMRWRQLGILFAAAATSDEEWTDEIKAEWKKFTTPG